jgi:hypothetical protein
MSSLYFEQRFVGVITFGAGCCGFGAAYFDCAFFFKKKKKVERQKE